MLPYVELPAAVDDLIAIASERPEPGWDPMRSRAGAGQYRPLYTLLGRYLTPGARVLDWGAGLGHLSYVLLKGGYKAVGFALEECSFAPWMDWSRYSFARAGPTQPTALPFMSASFDAVVSVGVLEHVRELGGHEAATLAEVERILCPGGTFICVHLPNRRSWIERAAQRAGRRGHQYRFDEEEIRRLVQDAGSMTVIEWFRYGIVPRNFWARAPRWVRLSSLVARTWDLLDLAGSALLNPFCQNFAFVARKPLFQSD